MFVLIWVALLFSVRGSIAYTGASVRGQAFCESGFCITFSEREITAEAELCVVIPCSFTPGYSFTPQNMVWYKCEPSKQRCGDSDIILHTSKNNKKVQSEFKGRVSLLEPDVDQRNCSIIINDLTESDSGSYQFRVNGVLQGYTDGFKFSSKATVSVKDLIQKPTVMIPPLTEGQQTTLTCTAPGLCSGSPPNITWTWSGTGENVSHITGNITAFKTEKLTAVTQRHSSTLTFNSSAIHHGTNITCKVSFTGDTTTEETLTLNVTYIKKPVITGDTTVEEGTALNLTCSVKSFPLSQISWTILGSNTNLQKNTGSATLVIPTVTEDHSGKYICTAKYLDTTVTKYAYVTVTLFPKILNNSGCVVHSEVLTCVCISEGIPLPTISWPLVKKHTVYTVINTVSNHTVNGSVILTVKGHSNTVVECVSSNVYGEAKQSLTIWNNTSEQEVQSKKVLKIVSLLEVIIAFLIGVLLSAALCCLAEKCRKKQKSSGNLDETLEMVTNQEDPLIDVGQAVEDDQTYYQEAAEEGEAVAAEMAALDLDDGSKDVEYASIDFSMLKRSSREAAKKQDTTETEYAEIKKEVKEERKDNGGEEGEVLEGKEEEAMIGEDEETKHCVPEEEEGEDVAVYSNVKEIMGEI